ncbi:hypothetical protein OsccyDRAFT_1571 [Leptolyngbyaceae cyanobacterium JSC-12]|nr:hypothetical protein OsccyDRAFT_1571 [Leptolyngbyaceae cyanobacterium JSC-12]
MRTISSSISSCRHCQFYFPEGRRGGHCKKLNVSVKSCWTACSLATPPFAATWKELESITVWKQKVLLQEEVALTVEATLNADLLAENRPTVVMVSPQLSTSYV